MSQYPTDLFRTSCGTAAPLELNVSGPGLAGGRRHVFEHPFVLVGRHERSGLRLEDDAVSRQHAYLQQLGGRVFCVDLGSRTGVRWGGGPRPAGWLRPGQGVQIGPYTLELATAVRGGEEPGDCRAEDWDPLRDRASDPRSLPRVTVEAGSEVLAHLSLNRALVLVGSSPDCRIRLRDSRVWRYHCSLLRTPQGVWLINLLPGADACLNGQPLRWGLVKDGDRVQVGPYVLRVWYPEARTETSPPGLAAIPAEDRLESGPPSYDRSGPEPAAIEASALVAALRAELEQAREGQRDAEALRQQLADTQAECDRLRERAGVLEGQVAETASLQGQLEAGARELDAVRGERDRWQAEAHDLQAKLASAAADREQLGRLAADLHATQAERDRLQAEHQSSRGSAEQATARAADLERALAEAAAAHEAALAQARERQQDAAALQQQLADTQAEGDRHRERAGALEVQLAGIADLQGRREAAEAGARELDAVRGERDRWQAEVRDLQDRLASAASDREQLGRLAADLDAARADRDRLQAEHQSSRDSAEQVTARAADLERALAEAAAAHEAALAQCRERERDAAALRQQLADTQAEGDRHRERAGALDAQLAGIADLQGRLEAAEAGGRELDAVRGERDRWQAEARDLQAKLASAASDREQLGRLAADLDAARAERDRVQAEHQSSRGSAELATARAADLERALAEAAAAHEATLAQARAAWESERQAPEARPEQERPTDDAAVQAAIRTVQAQVAADLGEWQQRLEAAEQQLVWERGVSQLQGDQLRQQLGSLQAERDRLVVRLAETELRLRAAEARSPEDAGRAAELQLQRQQAARDQVFVQLSTPRQ
jgi:pSer/pThr/pTyr-binding forkhead associated (FHA) protein/chromosome segregation ATPase